MTGWVRDRLRHLARTGNLGRRISAAPVVVPPRPQPAAPASPAAEKPAEQTAPPNTRLAPAD